MLLSPEVGRDWNIQYTQIPPSLVMADNSCQLFDLQEFDTITNWGNPWITDPFTKATPPIGKSNQFIKITVSFEPMHDAILISFEI